MSCPCKCSRSFCLLPRKPEKRLRRDMYCGRVGHDGKVSPNSTCPDPTSEASHVFDYYRSVVYPLLQPHHRVFLVPGLFGADNDSGTDEVLASKFESFWKLATKDPRVLGFKPCKIAILSRIACCPPR